MLSTLQYDNNSQTVAKHFDLQETGAYQLWRQKKLADYPLNVNQHVITIKDYQRLNQCEKNSIQQSCRKYNLALYKLAPDIHPSKHIPNKLAQQLGLHFGDQHLCGNKRGVSEIKVSQTRAPGEYIPYTNKAINWHTDGYYNANNNKIFSLILHCANSAFTGGENEFFDHEILYILLRDENPDYIHVLMQSDVMAIPENVQDGTIIRPQQTGPVFSINAGQLHMRYTARTHSIRWKSDPMVKKAIQRINDILMSDSIYKIKYRLSPGEGLICNNVLHMRTKFEDDVASKSHRLIYRMRFCQRIA